jgi:hypothetical protein
MVFLLDSNESPILLRNYKVLGTCNTGNKQQQMLSILVQVLLVVLVQVQLVKITNMVHTK